MRMRNNPSPFVTQSSARTAERRAVALNTPRRRPAWCTLRAPVMLLICFLAFFFGTGQTAAAPYSPVGEYQVKAAFILNFANFVEWPPDTTRRNLVIGIVGEDPFAGALSSLNGKTVKGRSVVVRYYDDVTDTLEADILYISPSERPALARILKTVKGRPILTVSDTRGFMRSGVMINMLVIQKRIGFEINTRATNQAGLRISSHLLKLAKEVVEP
jgi:hypothetical protein